jgi:hypothetical protein
MVSALSLEFLSFLLSLRRNAGKQPGISDGKLLAASLMIIIVLHDTLFEILEASYGMARKPIVELRQHRFVFFSPCANS